MGLSMQVDHFTMALDLIGKWLEAVHIVSARPKVIFCLATGPKTYGVIRSLTGVPDGQLNRLLNDEMIEEGLIKKLENGKKKRRLLYSLTRLGKHIATTYAVYAKALLSIPDRELGPIDLAIKKSRGEALQLANEYLDKLIEMSKSMHAAKRLEVTLVHPK